MLVTYPHRITIERLKVPVNIGGVAAIEYETFAENVPAAIEPLRGKAFWEAQAVSTEITTKIRFRYIAGITPAVRVKFGDRYFVNPIPINPAERNMEIHLMCKELYPGEEGFPEEEEPETPEEPEEPEEE